MFDAEQFFRVEIGGVAARQRDFLRNPLALDRGPGGFQHFGRNIETEELRIGIAARGQHQVAAGAAADFQEAARGRQMELLCIALDPKPEILDLCDSAYMTGLFSLLEVLINLPMQDIVKELPLQDEVLEALATPGQGGQLSRLLAALCAGEAGRYQEASERFAELGISPEKLTKAQATAFLWASHIDRISLD